MARRSCSTRRSTSSRAGLRDARRGRHAQGDPRGRRARAGHRARRRGAGRQARRAAARSAAARRRLAAARDPVRATSTSGSPSPRSRSSSSRRSPTSPTRRSVAWARRSSRSATPSSCPTCTPTCSASTSCGRPRASCSTARPAAARRSSPRPSPTPWPRRSPRRPAAEGEELLPQHQGPRAAQQVRRRDRAAHPPGLPAGPGEGLRGHPGHRVLRRDGLHLPHPRIRRLLRRREHDRARSCSSRSTASRAWRTSSSSAPPTART